MKQKNICKIATFSTLVKYYKIGKKTFKYLKKFIFFAEKLLVIDISRIQNLKIQLWRPGVWIFIFRKAWVPGFPGKNQKIPFPLSSWSSENLYFFVFPRQNNLLLWTWIFRQIFAPFCSTRSLDHQTLRNCIAQKQEKQGYCRHSNRVNWWVNGSNMLLIRDGINFEISCFVFSRNFVSFRVLKNPSRRKKY